MVRLESGTREQWLETRNKFVTATDLAAIVGADPWRGPMDVYADKAGLLGHEPPSLPMRVGTALEGLIAELYEARTENKVMANGLTLCHQPDSRLAATPDFWIVGDNALMESKVYGNGTSWGEDGSDDVPVHIAIQCHGQMAATGAVRVDVAVLLERTQFRVFSVERDEEMVHALEQIAEQFWGGFVEKSLPPAPGDSTAKSIFATFPVARRPLAEATPEQGFVIASLAEVRAELSALEECKEALEKQLKGYIGDAEGLEWEKWKVTWKNQSRKTVEWERLAVELQVPKALIERFTKKTEMRVLRWGQVSSNWRK